MNHGSSALAFALAVVLAACSQMPSRQPDQGTPTARFVDAKALGSGEYADVPVLTAVALRHLSATDAVARLQASLPDDVRLSHVGESAQLLIQGPGRAVTKVIRALETIDVR